MERNEWLKVVYAAACRVAEKHGPGLRAAVESADGDGALARLIFQVASEAIAASREIWPFVQHSGHPEPPTDEWRRAGSFEGAVVHSAVSALSADIHDMLDGLSAGRVPGPLGDEPSAAAGPGGSS